MSTIEAQASGKDFVISRVLNAPRDLVWECFTDPEHGKHWWGPKGFSVTTSTMQLRPGGMYHYAMKSDDGHTTFWGRMIYREIVKPERVVFVNSFSDESGGLARHPMAPTWPIQMLTVVTLDDLGNGKTRFTVNWSPLDPTDEERAAFEAGRGSMTNGWNGTFEKLEAYLAKL